MSQRFFWHMYLFIECRTTLIDIDQPGDKLLLQLSLFQQSHGSVTISGIMIWSDLLEADNRSVVHRYINLSAFRVILNRNFLALRHIGYLLQRNFVIAPVGITLGRIFIVVEGHARADDVKHGGSVMGERRLEEHLHLLGIATKRGCDKRGIRNQCLPTQVEWGQFVNAGVFELLA